MSVSTVNVIEYFNETIQNLSAFMDNPEGNKAAEALFTKIAKENGLSDIEAGLDDGYLESNDYRLYLVHSS